MSIRKRLKKITVFSIFFTFNMPRIPQNIFQRAIGMLNAGMTMNAVAMNNRCFCAI